MSRFMRLLIMFDLPVDTPHHRKEYGNFRKFLMKDGYDMVQFSIYSRICPNADAAETHLRRARHAAPRKGAVRAMIVTNRQFAEAEILTGDKRPQEKRIHANQLLLF